MTKPWRDVREKYSKLTPDEQAVVDAEVDRELTQMRLAELRRARQRSQETLADAMGIAQGDVSKIERRTDVYVRTLRRYIEAVGGTLHIIASFPDAEPIEIQGFGDIEPGEVADAAVAVEEPVTV